MLGWLIPSVSTIEAPRTVHTMRINPLVLDHDEEDDDEHEEHEEDESTERVPLTPRDSNTSSNDDSSSSIASMQSFRSANSYLQYFRSPSVPTTASLAGSHSRSSRRHPDNGTTNPNTPLYPVSELHEDYEVSHDEQDYHHDNDDMSALQYTVPDSYQITRERARRQSFHSTPGSGSSSRTRQRSKKGGRTSSAGTAMNWSVSSRGSSHDDYETGNQSVAAPSVRSSVSHLFGEELLLDDHVTSTNESSRSRSNTDQGVMLMMDADDNYNDNDLEQGGGGLETVSLESPLHLVRNNNNTASKNTNNSSNRPAWLRDLSENWSQVVDHVCQDWRTVRNFTEHHQQMLWQRRQALPMSPRSRNLADLNYLTAQHQTKVQQLMKQEESQDFYDFCLVLKPQEVYAFWATLLDFRVEMLGPEAAEATSILHSAGSDLEQAHTDSTSPSTNRRSQASVDDDDDDPEESRDYLPAGIAKTPLTGLHRRRHKTNAAEAMTPETTPRNLPNSAFSRRSQHPSPGLASSMSVTDSSRMSMSVRTRVSMFERAMGMTCSSAASMTVLRRQSTSSRSLLDADETTTAVGGGGALDSTPGTVNRRRWGNHAILAGHHPHMTPGMVNSPMPGATAVRRPTVVSRLASRSLQQQQHFDSITSPSEGAVPHSHSIRMQDIPNQVIPRGIAARTNGMLQFLSALKAGIVVRRHRAGQEAAFCKISSKDGGDTVQYAVVEHDEAMNAFKEQRVRYNKTVTDDDLVAQPLTDLAQSWSLVDGGGGTPNGSNDENNPSAHNFSVPDHVAAKAYRDKMSREKSLTKTVRDAVNKVVRSGSVKVSDIVAVHPGLHVDPRSDNGDRGTNTLRRSDSDFAAVNSFSLVLRSTQRIPGRSTGSIDEYENKWYKGEGSESNFTYFDLETATEGEYWLIFRGFLLLHRDAVVGRFAEQRAQGISSHYNRLELEHREHADMDLHNRLHRDEFHEPVTVGCLERAIVKLRDLDTTYMEGFTLPEARAPPSDYFLGFRSPGTQIWSRLRHAGFETQRVYSLDPRRVLIKVRCPSDRLMDVAEVLRLKHKTCDGSFAPFREDLMDAFQPLEDPLEFPPIHEKNDFMFRSSVRQNIIDFIVGSRYRDSGAELGSGLGNMVDARVPLHMPDKLDSIYNAWVFFWRVENWRDRDGKSMTASIRNMEETHYSDDDSLRSEVPSLYKRFTSGSFYQPLDSVEQYFGEKISFYFAWVQHTASHLVFLSIVGVFVFLLQVGTGNWDHPIRPYFSMIIMLWTFVVLVNWRKRANYLAYRWGTMNYKEQETTRPQFRGEDHFDEITQEWTLVYPKWKRWLKYTISFPLTLLFTCGSLILILWVHANRDLQLANYLEQKRSPGSPKFRFDFDIAAIGKDPVDVELTKEILRDPTFWLIVVGMPAMLGLCLPLLNFILMKLSVLLNDFENYRSESEYRSYLIIKVFSFRFMCYFATLYYYCFMSTDTPEAIQNGILRVGSSVVVYTTVAHWWQIFVHVYFPILIRKFRMNHRHKRLGGELRDIELEEEEITRLTGTDPVDELQKRQIHIVNKRLLLEQAQDGIWLEIMLPQHDSFPEYISAVVQFTFVCCFSVVFPLTPLICLFNYLLSMRLDAYKLCKGRRRPLAEKTGGIGVWEHLLHIVATISVLTNCWLMGFTTSQFSWLGREIGEVGLFAVVVCWEHIMLLIKYVMTTTISPLPKSVSDEIKREQFHLDQQRNQALQGRRTQYHRDYVSSGTDQEGCSEWLPPSMAAAAQQGQSLPTIPSEESLSSEKPAPTLRATGSPSYSVGLQTILSHDAESEGESSMAACLNSPPPPAAMRTPPLHPDLERRLYSA